ncbi:hypothetical protein PG996_007368 [Apiospora saccharicola]|uniref:Actin-like ATPase domain-containing protein n=1 Tax=Apiospora saccharicola TaxID=335842 RepID=A0ABR1VD53_9PEZI
MDSSSTITPPPILNSPSFAFDRPVSRQSSQSLGTRSRLILAFDFGTGYSSASYVLIEPARARLAEDHGPFADSDADDVSEASFESLELLPDRNEPYRWGYRVYQAWLEASTIRFRKFKLLLQDNIETADVREKLRQDLDILSSRGRRKTPIDLIIDFLIPFITHVKEMIQQEGCYVGTDKEIVMCIPTIWTQKACQKMHHALAKAFKSVEFEGIKVEHNSIRNLFIVSEPEAAAEVVLRREPNIRTGQRLVFVDAGWYPFKNRGVWNVLKTRLITSLGAGTVDLITYLVSYRIPLRLKEEGAPPSGGMCGSSFLNEKFQAYMLDRLKKHRIAGKKDETFLRRKSEEITYTQFEFYLKRSLDIYEDNPQPVLHISTYGIAPDKEQKFGDNHVEIPYLELRRIFLECFHEIWALVKGQLESCKSRGTQADKVVLIGGFANSPSLRGYLKRRLQDYDGGDVLLIAPKIDFESTVSSGAVLRAFDKKLGPQRHARSSYGILRHLPKDVYDYKHQKRNHRDANERTHPAPCTKEPYVRDTIEWFLKKVYSSTPLLLGTVPESGG